jgi:D-serine deaminase-like pyridoxal phosphate-dependent protein
MSSDDQRLHAHLIGQQGSRRALNTPVLVLDREALGRNIAAMAAFAKHKAIALRPHAKTHKSRDIALLQIAAGAVGICCAKLGEAEAIAAGGGVESILITSPVVTPQAVARLVALNGAIRDLRVAVDNLANAYVLAAAAGAAGQTLKVLIDIDPGIRRTGVASLEAAVDLARYVMIEPALLYLGVQFYAGSQQHIADFGARRAAIEERTSYLKSIVDALTAAGLAPQVVTGGGTGTHRIDADLGVLNELQVGSYVFMDRQYHECALTEDGASPYETSLFIDAHVVSANTPGMATIDAGFKAMSTDGGSPTIVSGAPDGASFHFMGDEHGLIVSRDARFEIGTRVVLGAPHCDPTVNLYDSFHVVSGDRLVDIWPVSARGRSR